MFRDRVEFKPTFKPSETRAEHLYEVARSVRELDQLVYPIEVYYRGVRIRILEVSKVETEYLKEYYVVVQFKVGDKLTKTFTIACSDIDDFIKKLRIEVMKFKIFNLLLPDTAKQL